MRCLLVVGLLLGAANSFAQETAPERFAVTGLVLDASSRPIAGSIVIPLTSEGIPLGKHEVQPLNMQRVQEAGGKDFVLFVKTNDQGRFVVEFTRWQLFESWLKTWVDHPDVTDLLAKNGSHLRIDGWVACEFAGEMEAAEELEIRPIGGGSIRLTSQEASDLLLISSQPLAGDPALGFMALDRRILGAVCWAAREWKKGEILISGLPAGEIQFYSFVNDNNGGWGGVRATIEEGRTGISTLAGHRGVEQRASHAASGTGGPGRIFARTSG